MPAELYAASGGANRKLREVYAASGGANRKMKEMYAASGGANRKIFTGTDPVLANNTWEQIAAASADGSASSLWSVGDEKTIVVDGETLTLQIYGFSHDDLTSGGKAGISFGLKYLMAAERRVHVDGSSARGDFRRTELYSWLQTDLFNTLPVDLRVHIKSVYKLFKIYNSGGGESAPIKLFLFSEHEVLGTLDGALWWDTGLQYPYFANVNNRKKQKSWWTMSVYKNTTDRWCNITSLGVAGNAADLTVSRGINFGFCI